MMWRHGCEGFNPASSCFGKATAAGVREERRRRQEVFRNDRAVKVCRFLASSRRTQLRSAIIVAVMKLCQYVRKEHLKEVLQDGTAGHNTTFAHCNLNAFSPSGRPPSRKPLSVSMTPISLTGSESPPVRMRVLGSKMLPPVQGAQRMTRYTRRPGVEAVVKLFVPPVASKRTAAASQLIQSVDFSFA